MENDEVFEVSGLMILFLFHPLSGFFTKNRSDSSKEMEW